MNEIWLYSIASVIIVSLISLIGIVTLVLSVKRLKKILLFLVSFAAGALFAGAFVHLLPNLIGDGVHNLVDGLVIGASYLVGIPLGITTTIAIILHEIPQEIGDFGVLVHGGFTRKKALMLNLLTALTAVAGVIISLLIGTKIQNYTLFLLPFTAGGFIYIAGSDLIPELHKEVKPLKSLFQLIAILLGIGIMFLLTFL